MKNTIEALALGETMVLVAPDVPGPLTSTASYRLRPGGAEANVAIHLARMGHASAWSGIVGDDPFGRLVVDYLAEAGVSVDEVLRHPTSPTGVYFKDTENDRTTVWYYRSLSAASGMSRAFIDSISHVEPAVLHLSGITPALSATCLDAMRYLIVERPISTGCLSFDVNYRSALWSPEEAGPELLALARAADVVFVGLDEAHVLWGTSAPEDVRALLPEPKAVVVKNAAIGAMSFHDGSTAYSSPDAISVVEEVGAGDAFAAGWLSGLLRGYAPERRLKLGHSVAAHVLSTTFDDVELPESLGAAGQSTTGTSVSI